VHKLDLYRLAVQHPHAEEAFLARVHRHHNPRGEPATRLKEDFAGSAVVASAWVMAGEDRRAIGVENHGATLRWASRRARREMGYRAEDLHFVEADVLAVERPRVDVVAALNFSVFIYHDRASLVRYFAAARRSLRAGGVLAVDAYGGAGAMRAGVQKRRVVPAAHERAAAFEYQWEQRSYDAATARVDCRIHFRVGSRVVRNAFRYDWRLWTLPELCEAMRDAGFRKAEVWGEGEQRDGKFRVLRSMEAREDWVAYAVGVK